MTHSPMNDPSKVESKKGVVKSKIKYSFQRIPLSRIYKEIIVKQVLSESQTFKTKDQPK